MNIHICISIILSNIFCIFTNSFIQLLMCPPTHLYIIKIIISFFISLCIFLLWQSSITFFPLPIAKKIKTCTQFRRNKMKLETITILFCLLHSCSLPEAKLWYNICFRTFNHTWSWILWSTRLSIERNIQLYMSGCDVSRRKKHFHYSILSSVKVFFSISPCSLQKYRGNN